MRITRKLRSLLRRSKFEADMAAEMQAHVDQQVERNITAGLNPTEARYAALRQFGNVAGLQEQAREQRGWRWLEILGQDGRFAVRMLRKHSGFTLAAVLTLALGIGFVTTLFTMINGVAFQQLPFEDASRIVSLGFPATRFDEYARQQQGCEQIALTQPGFANLRAGAFASRCAAATVTTNFLDVLRVRPAQGRGFLPEDGLAGAPRTVLIGHELWAREFGPGDAVAGREVQVNGEMRTIVGVMPQGFGFPFNQELWIPWRADEPVAGGLVFGRLRHNVSLRQASEEFTAIARGLPRKAGDESFVWDADARGATDGRGAVVEVVPFAERSVKNVLRVMLSSILGATFLVLLLACANVANLLLARAIDRKKEMALRAALGASRGRLIRQMLTESVLVAVLGAAGGLLIATWTTQGIWTYMMTERPLTGGAPFWMNFNVDGSVFAFVAVVTLLASLVTGLVPALRASRVDLNDALKDGAGGGLRLSRFSRVLINVQMAFSVCLVTVAGLFVTVLLAFNYKQLPYEPASILTAQIALDGKQYDDAGVRNRFFDEVAGRLQARPGVEAAALTSAESLRLARNPRFELEGDVYARDGDRPAGVMETVSAGFTAGFGIGLLEGRAFTALDNAGAPPVAIVNAAFAARHGGKAGVLGRRLRLAGNPPTPWITIVGVVPDLGSMKAGEASRGPVIYRPLAQADERVMTILVRGRGDVTRLGTTVRQVVAALDPELPVARLQTVQEIIAMERVGMNAFAVLFIACGLGALLLASVGIYGVVAFAVKMRTREFGVRLALGATRAMITRLVVGQGVRQIRLGLAVGVLLAVAASTVLGSVFFGFGRSGHDGWIYAGVVVLLAGVAGAALYIPARRAARVDPAIALRAE